MNIIKIQDQLKGVPDNTLVGYVQNPTGQVPTYLALSELQRRKEMRSKYQAAQPQDKTVAEDLVQESQPGIAALPEGQPMQEAMEPPPEMPMEQMAQGGLAELDTGTMYDENNYASGGIVAFGDGGGVKHYKKGDYVLSSDYDPEAYGTAYKEGLAGIDTKYPIYSATDPYGNVRKKAIKEYQATTKTPYDDAIRYYEEQGLGYKGKLGVVPGTSPVRKLENAREEWLSNQGAMPASPAVKPSNQPDVTLTGDKDATKQKGQPGVGFDGSFYDKMLGKEKTLQELSDEYKAVLGTDPTLAARQERLAKMDAKAAKMEEQAPWMALAKAGFEMASARPEYGKGQSAIADIARGAGAGLKEYGEAKDRLTALEEKRLVLDTELSKQQRAEQMAALTYGVNSRQHTEEINKTIMLAKAKDKLSRDVANLEANVALSKAGATNAPKIKDIAEARASYQNSPQQKETIKALLKTLGDNADKPSSDRHKEYLDGLRIAEENYLANYFAPIGSNIPTASTEGFKIKK